MYRSMGQMIFEPGAIQPRQAPPVVHLPGEPGYTATVRGPPVVNLPPKIPALLPPTSTAVAPAVASTASSSSNLPIYIAVGGVAILGIGVLLLRR